jgi:predicted RNA-binding protein with PUA-like domain
MPNYWILKTEPDAYSFDDLVTEKRTVWDGVRNPYALKNMRAMKVGDPVLIYHTGKEKAAVGLARVVKEAYPDPDAKDAKLVAVDIEVGKRLTRPVSLASVKADKNFADFALVRQPRLSVIPTPERLWKRLLSMAGTA